MDRLTKKRLIVFPLIVALIVNPALAGQQQAALHTEQAMRQRMAQQAMRSGVSNAVAASNRAAASSHVQAQAQAAQLIVDQAARQNQQARIKAASNGTTVVDIAEASAAGVSHNQFTAFNVDENGLILNNSQTPVLTQLGGWTDGNRNLAGGTARIILNEVTGNTASSLLGFIEVAGQSAEFVLANQNGIACNGCGFINIPRASLVTGTAVMNNGNLAGFTLGAGRISIDGAGLNAAGVDRFDIVTRAAQINANIFARELNIATGNDYFDYQTGVVSSNNTANNTTPLQFSLDASALGGMYANSIRLLGTEQGLGVNTEGLIQSVGELVISADGSLVVKNATSNQSVLLASAAGDITTSGQVYAPSVSLNAFGDINNTGLLAASNSLSISGQNLHQSGALYAGLLVDGALAENAIFEANIRQSINNSGSMVLADQVTLQLDSFDNTGGQFVTTGNVNLSLVNNLTNTQGVMNMGGERLLITAQNINNEDGNIRAENTRNTALVARDALNNNAGVLVVNGEVNLSANNLENQNGVLRAGELAIIAQAVNNQAGTLEASTLTLQAQSLNNAAGSLLVRGEQAENTQINIEGDFNNEQGTLHTEGDALSVIATNINNTAGYVGGLDSTHVTLNAAQSINNTAGDIRGNQITATTTDFANNRGSILANTLTLNADTIENNVGVIQAGSIAVNTEQYTSEGGVLLAQGNDNGILNLIATQTLTNTGGAVIEAHGQGLSVTANEINNTQSRISNFGAGALTLSANTLNNTAGSIDTETSATIFANTLNNNNGAMGGTSVTINTNTLINTQGDITANQLSVDTQQLINTLGFVTGVEFLDMHVGTLTNANGQIYSGSNLSVNLTGQFDNTLGVVAAANNLTVSASGVLRNNGSLRAGRTLQVSASNINNTGQLLGQAVQLNATILENTAGSLIEGATVALNAESLVNAGNVVATGTSNNALALNVVSVTNSGLLESFSENLSFDDIQYGTEGGSILHHGEGVLSINTGSVFNNTNGRLVTAGSLSLDAQTIQNQQGEIAASRGLSLQVSDLNNESGILRSGGGFSLNLVDLNNQHGVIELISDSESTFNITHTLDNRAGEIAYWGGGNLAINAGSLNNTEGGSIVGGGEVALFIDQALDNSGGNIAGVEAMSITANTMDNTQGQLEGQSLTITASNLNNGGTILATGNSHNALTLVVDDLLNTGLVESYGVDLDLSSLTLANNGGQVLHHGAGVLSIAQNELLNDQGQIFSAGSLSIHANQLVNRSGELLAEGDVLIVADNTINEGGLLQAGNTLEVTGSTFTNTADGQVIVLGDTATFTTDTFSNQASVGVNGRADVNAATAFNNTGSIEAQALTIATNALSNRGSMTAGTFDATAQTLVNDAQGRIDMAEGRIASSSIDNAGVLLAHNENAEGLLLETNALTNTGRLESHSENFVLNAQNINNTNGTIVHAGTGVLSIAAINTLQNTQGIISANQVLQINANTINNSNGQIAGVSTEVSATQLNNNNGLVQGDNALTITADALENTNGGVLLSNGTATIMSETLNNNLGQVSAADLTLAATTLDNTEGVIAADNAHFTVTEFNNTRGQIASDEISLTLNSLNNTAGSIVADTVTLETNTFNNTDGDLVAGSVILNANNVDNTRGVIASHDLQGDMTINASTRLNNTEGLIQGDGQTMQITTPVLDNLQGGRVLYRGDNTLALIANNINNVDAAVIASYGNLTLDVENALINQDASIQSADNSVLTAVHIENRGGEMSAGTQLQLNATTLLNTAGVGGIGWIVADWVDLTVDQFTNTAAARVDAQRLLFTGERLENNGLLLAASNTESDLSLNADELINNGQIESVNGAATIASSSFTNTGQLVHSGTGVLALNNTTLVNAGDILSSTDVSIVADTVDNTNGTVVLFDNASLSVEAETLVNNLGELSAAQINVQADTLRNIGGNILADTLILSAQTLENRRAVVNAEAVGIISANNATLIATNIINSGSVQANQLSVTAATINNTNGVLLGAGSVGETLIVNANTLNNTNGRVESAGENLSLTGALNNTAGTIVLSGTGVLSVTSTEAIQNTQGVMVSSGNLAVESVAAVNNNEGLLRAENNLTVTAATLDNNTGTIVSGNRLALNAQAINNSTEGLVLSLGTDDNALQINTNALNNNGGTIETSAENQTLSIANLNNTNGQLTHLGAGILSLNSTGNTVLDGTVVSAGSVFVNTTGTLQNAGNLIAANNLQVDANTFINNLTGFMDASSIQLNSQTGTNAGVIQTNTLALLGQTFTNSATEVAPDVFAGGKIIVEGEFDNAVQFSVTEFNNTEDANLQIAGTTNTLNTQFNNTGGTVLNLGQALNFTGLNNNGGQVYSAGDLGVTQNNVNNDNGLLRADGNIVVNVQQLSNIGGDIQALAGLDLQAQNINNNGGSLYGATQFNVAVSNLLTNLEGSLVSSAASMNISANVLENERGFIDHAGTGNLVLAGIDTLNNNAGQINTAGRLSLNVTNINNNAIGDRVAVINAVDLSLTATALNNTGGYVQGSERLSMTLPTIDNRGGTIIAGGTSADAFTLTTQTFNNSDGGGLVVAAENLVLGDTALNNNGGTIDHQGSGVLSVNTSESLQNATGSIQSAGNVAISATNVDNQGGRIFGDEVSVTAVTDINNSAQGFMVGNQLQLTANTVNNTADGVVASIGQGVNTLALNVTAFDNSGGTLRNSSDNWIFAFGNITNTGGSIIHTGAGLLTLNNNTDLQLGGTVASTGDILVNAQSLTNTGELLADGNLSIVSAGDVTNAENAIMRGQNLSMTVGNNLTNAGGITSFDSFDFAVAQIINNTGGIVTDAADATMTAGSIENTGLIAHNGAGDFVVTASTINNQVQGDAVGTLKSSGTLILNTTDITNAGIVSAATLNVTGFDSMTSVSGSRIEAGNINFQGNRLDNSGQLVSSNAQDALTLSITNINNTDAGVIASNSENQTFTGNVTNAGQIVHAGLGALKIGTAGIVDNTGGTISTEGTVELGSDFSGAGTVSAVAGISILGAGTFNNDGSELITGGNIQINAGLTNIGGLLSAGGVLGINGNINNTNGSLQGSTVQITANTLQNTNGRILSLGNGTGSGSINTVNITNTNGTIASSNNIFSVTANGAINNSNGTIQLQNGNTLNVNAGLLNNLNGGRVQSTGQLNLSANTLNNTSNSTLAAERFTLNAQQLNNTTGASILSLGTGDNTITVTDFVNAAIVSSIGESLTINASSSIDNTGGVLAYTGQQTFTLSAPTIINGVNSTIASNGTLELTTTGQLVNGGDISGRFVNNINAAGLINTGSIESQAGILTLDLNNAALTNSGRLFGETLLGMTLSNFSNTGTIASNNIVRLDMNTLSLAGTIEAVNLLDISVVGNVNLGVADNLLTEGSLALDTQGSITNAGTISANDALWLSGSSLVNAATGTIKAGNINPSTVALNTIPLANFSSIQVSGNVENNGVITGSENFGVMANNITNHQNISAGNQLVLLASDINNTENSVLFSGGDMTLGFENLTNNNAEIFSVGHMFLDGRNLAQQVAGTGSAATGNAINNINGTIESLRNMTMNTAVVNNTRLGIDYVEQDTVVEESFEFMRSHGGLNEYEVLLEGFGPDNVFDANGSGINGSTNEYERIRISRTAHTVTDNNLNDAFIASSGNMIVNNAAIENTAGTINVGGNFALLDGSYHAAGFQDQTNVITDTTWEYYLFINQCPTLLSDGFEQNYCGIGQDQIDFTEELLFDGDELYGAINVAGTITGVSEGDFVVDIASYQGTNTHDDDLDPDADVNASANNDAAEEQSHAIGNAGGVNPSLLSNAEQAQLYGNEEQGADGDINFNNNIGTGNTVDGVGTAQVDVDISTLTEEETKQDVAAVENSEANNNTVLSFFESLIARYTAAPDAEAQTAATDVGAGENATNTTVDINTEGATDVATTEGTTLNDVDATETNVNGAASVANTGDSPELAAFKDRAAELGLVVVLSARGQYVMVAPTDPRVAEDYVPVSVEITALPGNYNLDNLSGLYVVNPGPDSLYLIEARPQFSEYTNFLGSDYLLAALGYDPDKTHKRLGDAFYENELIRNALMSQATTRYLGNNTNDYEQMQWLMDNAVATNRSMNLTLGIALTSAQAANLTDDIVWMVRENISGQSVLVPRLYLASVSEADLLAQSSAVRTGGGVNLQVNGDVNLGANLSSRGDVVMNATGDINQNADLFSAGNIGLTAEGNLTNRGTIQGDLVELGADGTVENWGSLNADRGLWVTAGENIINQTTGAIISGGTLDLTATQNVINAQGYIEGVDVNLTAIEGDIINRTEFEQITRRSMDGGSNFTTTTVGEASTIISHNNLSMNAGNNIDLQGSELNATNDIYLNAGNDVLMGSVEDRESQDMRLYRRGLRDTRNQITHDVVEITAGNNLVVTAGNNIVGEGTQLSAGNSVLLEAENDITFNAVANTDHSAFVYGDRELTDTTITHTQATISAGNSASLQAGQDINLIGSNVIAGGTIDLHAERDTNLIAVNDSEYHYSYERNDHSFGRSETTISESREEAAAGGVLQAGGSILINSQVGVDGLMTLDSGNVNIAGGVVQAGDHVLISAGEDINITGTHTTSFSYEETRESGFSGMSNSAAGSVTENVGLNSAVISAGEQVILDSGNNVALIGTNIDAGGDIHIEAFDQVLISAGEEINNTESWDKSSGMLTDGNLYSSDESRAGESAHNAVASQITAGGRVNIDSGSTRIVGSDIHGEEGVNITADMGNIEIVAATNTSESFSFDESKNISAGDMMESMTSGEGPVENKDGRLSITLANAAYDRVENQTHITDMSGSTITSGGRVVVSAMQNIEVEGSTLVAGVGSEETSLAQDEAQNGEPSANNTEGTDNTENTQNAVVLSAGGNVNITEAGNSYESETKEIHGTAEVSVVVQHQAVEVVKAAIAAQEAEDKLKDAKRDLDDYKDNLNQLRTDLAQMEEDVKNDVPGAHHEDLIEMREIVAKLEDDKKWYETGVVLAAANLTAKVVAVVQQSAAAAASTGTYGFNAGVQLDLDVTKSNESIKETTSLASNIIGDNIYIQTGVGQGEEGANDATGTSTTIQGSNLQAENILSIDTGTLDVLASRDTVKINRESEHAHITAQITVYGAAGGASISGDYSRSKEGESYTTFNNSNLSAGTMVLNTTEDLTIRGGTVRAEDHLAVDVGGDLTVESVQNRSRTNNNSLGVSAGFSFGGTEASGKKTDGNNNAVHTQGASDVGGLAGVNGGVNGSNGMSVTRTTVLSSLTSGGTADVNVEGTTQITGALLATTDADGNDLGNLNLTTSDFNITDLRQTNISSQTSAAISTSVSLGGSSKEPTKEGDATSVAGNAETVASTTTASNSTTASDSKVPSTAKDNNGDDLRVNTTNISYSNTSTYEASNSMATLGHGNITVGGVQLEENGELTEAGSAADSILASTNRDTASTTNELWDIERTEGNVELTVDHRMLSESGREEIKEDFVDTGEFGQDIVRATGTIVDSDVLGITNFWNVLDNNAKGTQLKNDLLRNPENAHIMAGLESTDPAVHAQAVADLGHLAQIKFGLDLTDINFYDAESTTSYSLEDTLARDSRGGTVLEGVEAGNIFLDASDSTGKVDTIITLGEEIIETQTFQQGGENDNAQEAVSQAFGAQLGDRINQAAGGDLDATGGATFNSNLLNSTVVALGTERANAVGDSEVDNRQFRFNEASMLDRARSSILGRTDLNDLQTLQALYELDALACAAVHCASGIPKDDARYDEFRTLQDNGRALNESGNSIQSVLGEMGMDTILPTVYSSGPVTVRAAEFIYVNEDSTEDLASAYTGEFNFTVGKWSSVLWNAGVFAVTNAVEGTTALITGTENTGGFSEFMALRIDDTINSEYVSNVGNQVANSRSLSTYESAPAYVLTTALSASEVVPIGGVAVKGTKKTGEAVVDIIGALRRSGDQVDHVAETLVRLDVPEAGTVNSVRNVEVPRSTVPDTPGNTSASSWSNEELQGSADKIHSVLAGRGQRSSVTTVSVTPEGTVVVSTTGRLPTPAQRAEANRIFGEGNVEFVGGGKTADAVGVTGHHAEQRGINNLGESTPQGTRQASSHYACDGCVNAQQRNGIDNVTGSAADNGGRVGRPLNPEVELPNSPAASVPDTTPNPLGSNKPNVNSVAPITDSTRLLDNPARNQKTGALDTNYRAPEASNTPIESFPAPKGTRVEMAIDESFQINPLTGQVRNPGSFASGGSINSVRQARTELAIKEEFKDNITHVQEFEIVPGTRVQQSTVGPQVNPNGTTLPGGGSQLQILSQPGQRNTDVLIPIGDPKPIK